MLYQLLHNKSNIFLCGFMGCGKSTFGKIISKKTDLEFIDLDKYIEQEEKCTIPYIFKKKGECYFRQLEYEHTTKIIKRQKKFVISMGGGAIIDPKLANLANDNGIVIFLDLPFKMCYKNIRNDKKIRPLNTGYEALKLLYKKRYNIYKNNCFIRINIK